MNQPGYAGEQRVGAEAVDAGLASDWWRCRRSGPVSGRYEGEATAVPVAGQERLLDLRVDIDPRYENSPVMENLSGDLYQVHRIRIPGRRSRTWRVYQESWIVEEPEVAFPHYARTMAEYLTAAGVKPT